MTRPALHDAEHAPKSQSGVAPEHVVRHEPQFAGSSSNALHASPQTASSERGHTRCWPPSAPEVAPGKASVTEPHATAASASAVGTMRAIARRTLMQDSQ
jgi:hypothetical protein